VRQIEKERGAKQPDHPRQRHIEALAGTRHLRLAVDVLGGSHKAPARDHDDDDAEHDEGKSGRVGERWVVRRNVLAYSRATGICPVGSC